MISDTFCILPWIHLATRPNGDIRVCCTANASGVSNNLKEIGLIKNNGINMNLRTHSIEDVWNSEQMCNTRLQMLNGQIPSSCQKCFIEEENGIVSKRQWETKVWSERVNVKEIISMTSDGGELPVSIPYFDLRLGNLCQLKCIMCSPHDSSSWIKDWKLQYPNYINSDLKKDQRWDSTYDYNWYQKSTFLDSMKNQAQNIKELYFAGGEPLLIPEHYKILEFMVENNYAKDCILRYNSNGLEISDRLFDLWDRFKSVKFNFSVDAVGKKNNYIRFPSEWNNIVKNLHRLDNTSPHITVNIACAVQILNVLYLTELIEWKNQQNFKKINIKDGAGIIGSHLVYFPSYLNVRVLPIDLKKIAKEKINNFVELMGNDANFINNSYGKNRWLGLIKYMMEEDWTHMIPSLKEYLESCDKIRNTNYKIIFPELSSI
jgi:organic radical activating enzyme